MNLFVAAWSLSLGQLQRGLLAYLRTKLPNSGLAILTPNATGGHAQEYVEAMWLMLQQSESDGYVVATGATHSVREFVELAFQIAGLDYAKHLTIGEELFHPSEVRLLRGDTSKARQRLGWTHKASFKELVSEMLANDCRIQGVAQAVPLRIRLINELPLRWLSRAIRLFS